MKPRFLIGIVLIVLGIVALVYQGITYTKPHTTEIGPLQITTEQQKTIPLPPILGVISLVGGILLVAVGSKDT